MEKNKIKTNLKKTEKLRTGFVDLVAKQKVPCYVAGVVIKKDGNPRFLEAVIRRPEKYNQPELGKKLPKTYKGIKIKVV